MFQNYITTALRNIFKHKLYSFSNIGGLAIGLAACMLILLFVKDELAFDNWIPDAENIYMIETTFTPENREPMEFALAPGMIGERMVADYAEIDLSVRVYAPTHTFLYEDQLDYERGSLVDVGYFELFPLNMIAGNFEAALANNSSMIISQTLATKYFGDENPLGQTVFYNNKFDYTIVGIFEDIPENTHFTTNFIALLDPLQHVDNPWLLECWWCVNLHGYVRLSDGADPRQLEADFPEFVRRHYPADHTDPEADQSEGIFFELLAVPDAHLYGDKVAMPKVPGDIVAVISFSVVALLILVIASINFMNLATARAMNRAREVSMRKVLGATRQQLVSQFLGEAVVTSVLALVLGVLLVEAALPWYNDFLGKELALRLFSEPTQLLAALSLALFVGAMGGLYPAFFLSNFRPARILHANNSSQDGSGRLRNSLVVLQFAISIALIVATGIVYGQTIYAKNLDMGINREGKVSIWAFQDSIDAVHNTLINRISAIPGILGTANSSDGFPQGTTNNNGINLTGDNADNMLIEYVTVGPNFFNLYDVQPLAGRLFSAEFRSDYRVIPEDETLPLTRAAVVNESFLGKAGWATPQDAVGQTVYSIWNDRRVEITIVGVVGDIHSRSLKRTVTPMIYYTAEGHSNVYTLHVGAANPQATLSAVEQVWRELVPDIPFRHSYVDDDFAELYEREDQRGQMFAAFSIFAVLVSCLGLYGLVSFAAERRTREIGVRKVMGASVVDIVRLLVWQFSKPVLWANIIAWPLAWYYMQEWLNGFQYRIDMDPFLFIGAGMIALAIAWATVAHRAMKVARAQPIQALRHE